MLTGFQLRAARAVLDIYGKDLAQKVELHLDTLKRLEKKNGNLSPLKCRLKTAKILINFFESQQIIFPDFNSIALKIENNSLPYSPENFTLTRFQLKAARIGMRLTQKELGEQINTGERLISYLETKHQNHQFLKTKEKIISSLKLFFIKNGIAFTDPYRVTLTKDS